MAEGLFVRRIQRWGDNKKVNYILKKDVLEIVDEAKAEFPLNPDWIRLLKKMLTVAEAKAKEMGTTTKLSDQKAINRTYDWFVHWFGSEEVKEK